MSAGERIRVIRKTFGLTQAKFAERVGISTSYVAEIELGNKKINGRIFRLISVEFNLDEHWLRTGEGAMYNENAKINLLKLTSLFKALSPAFQECALTQMNILADLYKEGKAVSPPSL